MFDHCLYFNTTALARLVEREWTKAFAPFGLTPAQAFMLRLVLESPGLLQHQIADALTISRPTATRLLAALEEKRFVERRSSPSDGRESAVYPTRTAAGLKPKLNIASGEVTARIKQLIGPEVFNRTVSKLRGIRTALK